MDDNLKLKYIYMETLKKQLCEKDETLKEKEKELQRSFMINEELECKLFQIMQELKQINSLKENIEKNCQKKILEQATLLEEFKSSLIASKEKEIQNQIKEKNEIQLKYSELCRKNTENEIKAQLLKYSNHCNYLKKELKRFQENDEIKNKKVLKMENLIDENLRANLSGSFK